jgi:hypothetical protein
MITLVRAAMINIAAFAAGAGESIVGNHGALWELRTIYTYTLQL